MTPPIETGRHRAVFLDRDGTVIVDRGYLADPEQIAFERGAVDALRSLAAAGWLLVVVTNQSGVARGYFDVDTVRRVNSRLEELLARETVMLDAIEFCPHRDEDCCYSRKPLPGMLMRAAAHLGIDLRRSVMIGDKASDLEAGRAAGAAAILVETGAGGTARNWALSQGFVVAADLRAAASLLLTAENTVISDGQQSRNPRGRTLDSASNKDQHEASLPNAPA